MPSTLLRRFNRAFTLVEILVVIAIIAILVAIILPVTSQMRKTSNTVKCSSNMRQIGVALQLFVNDKGRYPSQVGTGLPGADQVFDVAILPYLGDRSGAKPPMLKATYPALEKMASIFACPGDTVPRTNSTFYKRSYSIAPWTTNWNNGTSYIGFQGRSPNVGVPPLIVDKPSSAVTIVEWHQDPNAMGSQAHQYHDSPKVANDVHGGFSNCLFMDGHVDKIPLSLSIAEFQAKYAPGSRGAAN